MNTPDNNISVDYLIIGQGLAGSLLTWSLLQQGHSVRLVDNAHAHSSSMVAAGLVNPITGKRLLKADETDRCLSEALNTYQTLATKFSDTFYHPLNMLRLFTDEQQANLLITRRADENYRDYLDNVISPGEELSPFDNSYGAVIQQKTGYLDIPRLLKKLSTYFNQQGILLQQQLDYRDIQIPAGGVAWKNIHTAHCVFCEGYQGQNNPWFNWLPFQLTKGEILTIESTQIPQSHLVNKGNWLVPNGENIFRTGSTNQWDFINDRTTAEAKKLIEKKLSGLFIKPVAYRIIDQQAGIRPATRDKQPFIGCHPEIKQLGIFNGFGARGSLTIPYYAKLFSNYLVEKTALPGSVDIKRYYPL